MFGQLQGHLVHDADSSSREVTPVLLDPFKHELPEVVRADDEGIGVMALQHCFQHEHADGRRKPQ
ncbi:MAG: hypothetical protein PUB69_04100 [Desulfovibrionaceae bacterium]|nr:hypothetical protein [Desulfovibrionaceae bacterium]